MLKGYEETTKDIIKPRKDWGYCNKKENFPLRHHQVIHEMDEIPF